MNGWSMCKFIPDTSHTLYLRLHINTSLNNDYCLGQWLCISDLGNFGALQSCWGVLQTVNYFLPNLYIAWVYFSGFLVTIQSNLSKRKNYWHRSINRGGINEAKERARFSVDLRKIHHLSMSVSFVQAHCRPVAFSGKYGLWQLLNFIS